MKLLSTLLVTILFAACGTTTVFESPNALRNIAGTLYLNNGKKIEGKLIINTHNAFGSSVKVIPSGEKEQMQFSLLEVKGYEARYTYYALKERRSGNYLGRNLSFMKRLTKENSRIHLYENLERKTVNNGGNNNSNLTTFETQFFVELPGEPGVWEISSNKFVPNFDEKMSKVVADCPALAAKIANKQDGYFSRQVTTFSDKRVEVMMNIIDEYNACASK